MLIQEKSEVYNGTGQVSHHPHLRCTCSQLQRLFNYSVKTPERNLYLIYESKGLDGTNCATCIGVGMMIKMHRRPGSVVDDVSCLLHEPLEGE